MAGIVWELEQAKRTSWKNPKFGRTCIEKDGSIVMGSHWSWHPPSLFGKDTSKLVRIDTASVSICALENSWDVFTIQINELFVETLKTYKPTMNSLLRANTLRRMTPIMVRRAVSHSPVGVSHAVPSTKPAFNKALPVRCGSHADSWIHIVARDLWIVFVFVFVYRR